MNLKMVNILMFLLISISHSAWAVLMPANVNDNAISDELKQWLLDQEAIMDEFVPPIEISPAQS